MSYILISFIFLIFFYIFLTFGYFLNSKLAVMKNGNLLDLMVLGYSIFVIISFNSYFFLNLKNEYLLSFVIIFLIFFHINSISFITKNINKIFKYLLIILFYFLIFYLPVKLYGEQFYIFRGNYWDNFNYLSSSLLFSKYSYFEIKSLNFIENFLNFQSIESIITYRPYINYLLSLFLNLNLLDIFLINFSFKVFLSIINFFSFISFLKIFKKINENNRIILSFIFSFSFFSIYIFEIEALSHLGSISLFIISIKYLYLFSLKENYKKLNNIIIFSIFNASLFIVYPEIFIFYTIILFSYLLIQIFYLKTKFIIKNLLIYLSFFFLLTISSFDLNYKFLILQFSAALNPSIDWWTYFGAFIFGRDNLVLDINYITTIKENLINKNILELSKIFYKDHLKEGYNFIYINVLPSIFGLYYLTEGKIMSSFSYLLHLITLILNIYISLIIVKNISFIYKNKFKIVYISGLLIFSIIFYLILNGNFWTVIKLYSYCLIFIFILISINFKNQKIYKIIFLLLIIFPFYKYSVYNYGIGVLDSFPSIINKEYKTKINWNLKKKDLIKCQKIFTEENDYFVRSYINIKTLYADKSFENSINLLEKKNFCKVSIIEKNFVVASIND